MHHDKYDRNRSARYRAQTERGIEELMRAGVDPENELRRLIASLNSSAAAPMPSATRQRWTTVVAIAASLCLVSGILLITAWPVRLLASVPLGSRAPLALVITDQALGAGPLA